MMKWINAKRNEKNKSTIISQLDSHHKATVLKNRQYLKVIIETLMFTAQQNISQRGHEENRFNISEIKDINRGNFLELLSLRCRDLPWLGNMLHEKLEKRTQWTSPKIQNELLSILADRVLQRIIIDVQESGKFSIILDETSDISRIEQVSLCLSYIADGIKKETFVGFYDTKSTEGEVLYALVKKVIKDLNLELENIVGKCFDGAANMSGIYKGLTTRMKECSPLAIYIHCYGHRLNLAIQGTITQIVPLRKALGQIQSLYNFIESSPKRHAIFNDIQIDGNPIVKTLKSLSITRWSCHWEAVKAVYQELERIVKTLLILKDDQNVKTCTDSRNLLIGICDFDFIMGVCVLKIILSNTSSLSRYLQGKRIDVLKARNNAYLTIAALKGCRNERDFDLIWKQVEILSVIDPIFYFVAEFSFKEARVPRTVTNTMTPESHHRVNTYFLSLDKVQGELKTRFSDNDQEILCSLGEIAMLENPSEKCFQTVTEFYKLDGDLLKADFAIFKNCKANDTSLNLKSASEMYESFYKEDLLQMIPELEKILKIFAVIPATTCTAERSFSGLRRMKTYLRSTMGQEKLQSLALLNIERIYANKVLENDIDNVIDTFARRNKREQYFF